MNDIRKNGFSVAAVALGLLLLLWEQVLAVNAISLNFAGGDVNDAGLEILLMDPADVAGAVPVANWNQFPNNDVLPIPLELVDNTGAATTASVNLPTDDPVSAKTTNVFPGTGDNTMLSRYIYRAGFQKMTIYFAGIPYAEYDLYVYGDSSGVNGKLYYTIVETEELQLLHDGPELDSSFVQSDGAGRNDANYVKFSSVNLPEFTLQTAGYTSQFGFWNGIQIVEQLPPVEGDYNSDGTVNAADYVLWRKGVKPLANEVPGVTPGDATVEDYDAWRARYGNPPMASGGQHGLNSSRVPEPSTAFLCVFKYSFFVWLAARARPRMV